MRSSAAAGAVLPTRADDYHESKERRSSNAAGWPKQAVRGAVVVCLLILAIVYFGAPRGTIGRRAEPGRGRRPASASRPSSALRKLHGKPRFGVGAAVERACGERTEALTVWLDALHDLETQCPHLDERERAQIIENAKRQCGAWCIWDLETDEKVGWQLSKPCFYAFRSPHEHCDRWWFQRPGSEEIDARTEAEERAFGALGIDAREDEEEEYAARR
ncbi:hypothetical protein JCM8202_000951 [Rhodotorula sphaerocarpa]